MVDNRFDSSGPLPSTHPSRPGTSDFVTHYVPGRPDSFDPVGELTLADIRGRSQGLVRP